MTTTLRLAVAGLRYRGARSVMVCALAALSAAAAVLGPGYARAAEQSVLADHLRAAADWQTGFTVSAAGIAGDTGADTGGSAGPTPDQLARIPVGYLRRHARRTMLAEHYYRPPVAGLHATVGLPALEGATDTGRLVTRDGYCRRLRVVEGRCPRHTGEVLVSTRAPWQVGATVAVTGTVTGPTSPPAGQVRVRVVGRYRPPHTDGGYWFNHGYFGYAHQTRQGQEYVRQDAFFGSEATVRSLGVASYTVLADFTLRTGLVGLDDLPAITARLAAGGRRVEAAGLALHHPLTGLLSDIRAERSRVWVVTLLVAVQLVLLCWFVLFGVVRGAIDERGPELGLAKLRGLRTGRVAGFGLLEIGVLMLVAVPVGVALGLLGTELCARFALAAGVHAEARWPVLAAAAGAFAGALVAALVAARRAAVTPVVELLRRVPVRAGRLRAGLVDAGLVVLAAAACYQLLTGTGGRLGLLAGGLVAVAAGVLVGRLVPLLARRRVAVARRRGRVAALLAAARLSRRGPVPRTIALVTVAVALLCYGAVIWSVAGRNQHARAATALGAGTVYSVRASGVRQLVAAVRRADPDGHAAMAVARGLYGAGRHTTEVLAVDSRRLADVAYWRPVFADADVHTIAARLHPAAAPASTVRDGDLAVTVDVAHVDRDVTLVALLSTATRHQRVVEFGVLAAGRHRLTGTVTGCHDGCRLVGFDLYRGPDTPQRMRGAFTLTRLTGRGRALPAGLTRRGAWRGADSPLEAPVSAVSAGHAGTHVRFDAAGGEDLRVLHVDAPYPTPAVTVGHTEPAGAVFRDYGLYGVRQRYRGVAHAHALPAIHDGMLVDLTGADRVAGFGDALQTPMRYQVWAAPGAPDDLRHRLVAAGLTVTGTDTVAAHEARLARAGGALALRLYLVAAVLALLLAAGSVLVTGYLSARPVLHELAALRVAGVSVGSLRAAGVREYAALLGASLAAGALAGGLGAALALPRLPLAGTGGGPPPVWWPGPWWPAGAVLGSAALLALVTALLVGAALRRARPDRLREGSA